MATGFRSTYPGAARSLKPRSPYSDDTGLDEMDGMDEFIGAAPQAPGPDNTPQPPVAPTAAPPVPSRYAAPGGTQGTMPPPPPPPPPTPPDTFGMTAPTSTTAPYDEMAYGDIDSAIDRDLGMAAPAGVSEQVVGAPPGGAPAGVSEVPNEWLGVQDAPYQTQLTGDAPALTGSAYRDPIAQDDPTRLAEIQKQYGLTPNDVGYTGPEQPAVYSARWLASPDGQEYTAYQDRARAAEAQAGSDPYAFHASDPFTAEGAQPEVPDNWVGGPETPPPDDGTGSEPPATGGQDPYRAFQDGSEGTFDPATGTFTPETPPVPGIDEYDTGESADPELDQWAEDQLPPDGEGQPSAEEEAPLEGDNPEFDARLQQFITGQLDGPSRYDSELVQGGQRVISEAIDRRFESSRRILEEHFAGRGLTGSSLEGEQVTSLLAQLGEQERAQLNELGRDQANTYAQDVQVAGQLGISESQLIQNRAQMLEDNDFRRDVMAFEQEGNDFKESMEMAQYKWDVKRYGKELAEQKREHDDWMDNAFPDVTTGADPKTTDPKTSDPEGVPQPANKTIANLQTGWRPDEWTTWNFNERTDYLRASGMDDDDAAFLIMSEELATGWRPDNWSGLTPEQKLDYLQSSGFTLGQANRFLESEA